MKAPTSLDAHGKKVWKRHCEKYAITPEQEDFLEDYCKACSLIALCEIEIAKDGGGVLMPTERGSKKIHPVFTLINQAFARKLKAAKQLGMNEAEAEEDYDPLAEHRSEGE